MPEEIGRDLVTLQDLADLLRDIEAMKPRFRNLERLWRGAQSDVSRYQRLIDWAASVRDAVDACLIDGVAPERLLAHVQGLLSRDISRFRQGGKARQAIETMYKSFPAMLEAAKDLGACIGLDTPEDLIRIESGWIEALLQRTSTWKANVVKAPQWTAWRSAASSARSVGLSLTSMTSTL